MKAVVSSSATGTPQNGSSKTPDPPEMLSLASRSEYLTPYLSTWLVVMNTMRASVEATPSRALSSPLKVSRPRPWYFIGSGGRQRGSVSEHSPASN